MSGHGATQHHQRRTGVFSSSGQAVIVVDPEKPSIDMDPTRKSKARQHRWRWISWIRNYASQSPIKAVASLMFVLGSLWLGLQVAQRVIQRYHPAPKPPPSTLDFIVAGFPKSGTTTLLFSLSKHPEILMEDRENCQIARPLQQDNANFVRLNQDLYDLKMKRFESKKFSSERSVLGIKCPDALKNFKSIQRLSQHSPDCKFVIGLRHPIWYLQSFYNYRVLESYVKNVKKGIPTLHYIFEKNKNWCDVSPDATRFDLFLGQFGKTGFSAQQLREMFLDRPLLAVKPNRFPIFIYTLDQIQSKKQSDALRRDLQHFLGLTKPLSPLGHENKAHKEAQKYQESINICGTEFDNIRKTVLHHAEFTVKWILEDFLVSPDVTVSDRPAFVQSVQSWTTDPCQVAKSAK